MNDETRQTASLLGKSLFERYYGEPCCICRLPLAGADIRPHAHVLGHTPDGEPLLAHTVCYHNFVALLQNLPPSRLWELTHEEEP